ncbi:MAG: radical SAM/SPASM domain-containing protein, partial [Elusimicrobia bacterium]|nr:radical SAM/SPASM domain-containing protein [Elusimicrobiota bacterium]
LSLDGPDAALHDSLRGVPGAFERTLEAAGWARELGLPLQINTCFSRSNAHALEAMIELVCRLGVVFWEVFFLIPVGRGVELGGLSPQEFEDAFERLRQLEAGAGFVVKLTEGQHYRRYLAQHGGLAAGAAKGPGSRGGATATKVAVNAGKGFAFVDYRGDICPSGFLPLAAGNVRTDSIAKVYRDSDLFLALRDPSRLKGKCGACEFRVVCSGSRARAHAMTGDYLASDPGCLYEPAR